LKKLTGLLVFVLALAGAIALTKYYASRQSPAVPERPAPPPDAPPNVPPPPPPFDSSEQQGGPGAPSPNAAVSFEVRNAILNFETGKSHLTLQLTRDPARPEPEKIWVWAYFFTNDAGGERRYCSGEPIEVRRPFATGARETINVTADAGACPRPVAPTTNYYARVNVSAESAFAARLSERRISYDISSATPVVVQGARPGRR